MKLLAQYICCRKIWIPIPTLNMSEGFSPEKALVSLAEAPSQDISERISQIRSELSELDITIRYTPKTKEVEVGEGKVTWEDPMGSPVNPYTMKPWPSGSQERVVEYDHETVPDEDNLSKINEAHQRVSELQDELRILYRRATRKLDREAIAGMLDKNKETFFCDEINRLVFTKEDLKRFGEIKKDEGKAEQKHEAMQEEIKRGKTWWERHSKIAWVFGVTR